MIVVVDSNILFSSLLSANSLFVQTLLDEDCKFIAPNFIFVEIFKYKDKILKHSKLSADELLEVLNKLLSNIQFLPNKFISPDNLEKAIELCKDIDLKDCVFVALTLEMGAVLWTGDKKLKTALDQKGFNQFFSLKTN